MGQERTSWARQRFDDDPVQATVEHVQALRSRTLVTLPALDNLSPPGIPQQQQQQQHLQHLQHVQGWVRNKFRRIFAPFLVVLLCACLIAWRAGQWVRSPFFPVTGVALPLAKCFVTISEVCFGLLFLPVSRNLITWLRSTWLRRLIDFDAGLSHHKILAIVGALAGCAHGVCISIAYYGADALGGDKCSSCKWAWGSGWILVALILLAYPFAVFRGYLAGSRVGKALSSFSAFWFSHHVLILVFTPLLVVHSIPAIPKGDTEGTSLTASKAWLFIAAPVLIYALERLTRALRKVARKTDVLDARLLPGDVLEVMLRKPRSFRFVSGMYVYILCPAISKYEWHPFTITSAPQDCFITLHIRKVGDWTAALHELVARSGIGAECDCQTCTANHLGQSSDSHDLQLVVREEGMHEHVIRAADFEHELRPGMFKAPVLNAAVARNMQAALYKTPRSSRTGSCSGRLSATGELEPQPELPCDTLPAPQPELPLPEIFLDGAFGAPTDAWNDYEVVTLIGAGMGVTPMASVLRSLLHHLYNACCDKCGQINTRACAGIRQRKVYFHWVLRSAEGMHWLEHILATIAEADQQRRFDLHVHITQGTHPAVTAAAAGAAASPGGLDLDSCRLPDVYDRHKHTNNMQKCDLSGNRVHYSSGRPDFSSVLSQVQANHPGEVVGVFYCGPPALGAILEGECGRLNKISPPRRSSAAGSRRNSAAGGGSRRNSAAGGPAAGGPAAAAGGSRRNSAAGGPAAAVAAAAGSRRNSAAGGPAAAMAAARDVEAADFFREAPVPRRGAQLEFYKEVF